MIPMEKNGVGWKKTPKNVNTASLISHGLIGYYFSVKLSGLLNLVQHLNMV